MYCDICWQHPRKALTCETSIRERDHIPDGAEICILWLRSFASDGVVVEGYLFHSKLRLAGFDLYAGTLAAAYESLE